MAICSPGREVYAANRGQEGRGCNSLYLGAFQWNVHESFYLFVYLAEMSLFHEICGKGSGKQPHGGRILCLFSRGQAKLIPTPPINPPNNQFQQFTDVRIFDFGSIPTFLLLSKLSSFILSSLLVGLELSI